MPTLTKIGRYRVTRRLGSGAFATVWLAEDDVLESEVAIKVLADNWAHHPDVRARFEQEAQVLRRVDSEHLVRVHDFGELPDGRPYQVMTYASGGTLDERLAAGRMPLDVVLRTATAIAEGVTVLHDSGVLHRDLKPSNVLFDMVRGRERILVADLGLAKEIAQASGFTVVTGTPGYMAPEQRLLGGGLDVRADVHALGAMTYQMLTGQTPYADRTRLTAPSKLRPGIPKRIDNAVLRALDPDRARRWPSAQAFAAALDLSVERRLLRWTARITGAVIALAAVAAAGGATVPYGSPPGWVRVRDDAHALSVAVPASWARQLRDQGWNPASIGLPAGPSPGLQVGADLASSAGTSPAVLAGVSPSIRVPGSATLPSHDDCVQQPDRPVSVNGLSGQVRRWTACAGTGTSYSEILLIGDRGAYLQIRQNGPVDRTDDVLRTLRITRPGS
ncbi:serine/threonine-protein kinase [Actinoplanes palleronii]|uniref:non-specific serine/threonine protein kinase n=1 Tax=Actinoplanes palleronii TaxID=113570 RepID=A0ABQ4BUG8_9ACTN|nr:serine/threonine-protein kinase [Actinoplanes palleronii]GIE73825.1 serine/threonine protein kinase [Actinoplanes palleronii]